MLDDLSLPPENKKKIICIRLSGGEEVESLDLLQH